MSSNLYKEGGNLCKADWGCLAGRCVSLCLQAAAVVVPPAVLVSDEKRIRGVYTRRCAIQIRPTTFTFITTF